MEFKLIAIDTTCIEAVWIQNLLLDMPLVDNPIPPISIHFDCKLQLI